MRNSGRAVHGPRYFVLSPVVEHSDDLHHFQLDLDERASRGRTRYRETQRLISDKNGRAYLGLGLPGDFIAVVNRKGGCVDRLRVDQAAESDPPPFLIP